MDEVIQRLEADISDRDVIAIASAVTKALTRGFRLGIAFAEDEVRQRLEQAGFPINFTIDVYDPNPVEPDPWAEEFGDGEQSG